MALQRDTPAGRALLLRLAALLGAGLQEQPKLYVHSAIGLLLSLAQVLPARQPSLQPPARWGSTPPSCWTSSSLARL